MGRLSGKTALVTGASCGVGKGSQQPPGPEAAPVVEVVILLVKGSAPSEPGATMILLSDGSWQGTVGGGTLEHQLKESARQVHLDRGPGTVEKVTLGVGNDQCCGGVVYALVSSILSDVRSRWASSSERLYDIGAASSSALVAIRDAEGRWLELPGYKSSVDEYPSDELARPRSYRPGATLFVVRARTSCPLWIFGAGHVSRAVCRIAQDLPFRTHVFDARSEWAHPAAFPSSVMVHADAMPHALDPVPTGAVALIMTHSHVLDFEVLEDCLRRPFAYIGVIASVSKAKRFREALRQEGYAADVISTVRMPIGTIKTGKAPAEVAVGILAEVLAFKYQQQRALQGLSDSARRYTMGASLREPDKTPKSP